MKNFPKILSAINSKNRKVDVLSIMITEDPVIAKCFYYALNPFICYGFKKIPETEKYSETDMNWSELFNSLDNLSKMNHSNESELFLKNLLENCGLEQGDIVRKIILKDMRCGVANANFNLATKCAGFPEYEINNYPCMLVSSNYEKFVEKTNWKSGVYSQEKCDGMRFNARVFLDKNKVEFFGRSGKPLFISSEKLKNDFLNLAKNVKREYTNSGIIFDGEMLVRERGKVLERKTGNGILNKAVRGTISEKESEKISAVLWDVIPFSEFIRGKYDASYDERFSILKTAVEKTTSEKVFLVDTKLIYSEEDAQEDFKKKLEEGKEGVILKWRNSIWKDTRSTECVKLKAELDCDLLVTDCIEGTGKYSGMIGAIVCESSDGKVKVSIGSGFSDEQRKINPNFYIGKIVTVLYNARIKDKNSDCESLFLPRLVEIREDKTVANSSEEIR